MDDHPYGMAGQKAAEGRVGFMKKFVIVMITFLVLFVFIMLNYLLWDKENLQKQSASDKVQQDWLLGQNKTLQATIDEQEKTLSTLSSDNDGYLTRITGLEQQIRQANTATDSLNKQVDLRTQIIDNYKLLMVNDLKVLTQQWFENISSQNYEVSYKMLGGGYLLFGGNFDQEAYTAYISAIKSIAFITQSEEEAAANPVFEVLEGRGGEYEVITVATVEVGIVEEQKGKYQDMAEGVNRLQISYRYNPNEKTWAIFSVMEASE